MTEQDIRDCLHMAGVVEEELRTLKTKLVHALADAMPNSMLANACSVVSKAEQAATQAQHTCKFSPADRMAAAASIHLAFAGRDPRECKDCG